MLRQPVALSVVAVNGPPECAGASRHARRPAVADPRRLLPRRPRARGASSSRAPTARPLARSSRTVSQSGRERSRRADQYSAHQSISSCSPPGAGSAARRTCSSIANAGSGSHAGRRSEPTCGSVSRERYRGSKPRRRSISVWSSSSAGVPQPSLEHHHGADVHVRGLGSVLQFEERRVEAREPLAHAVIIHLAPHRGIRAECARRSGVSRSAYRSGRARHGPEEAMRSPDFYPTLQRRWTSLSRTSAGSSSPGSAPSSSASRRIPVSRLWNVGPTAADV